jgi:hypothetical protein
VKAIDALYNELKGELLAKLKDSILEDLKPVIGDLIKQVAQEIRVEEEYQLVEWFIEKYHLSRKTFYKYKKMGFVDTKQIGRYKLYNVKQWLKTLDKVQGVKPDFLNHHLSKVS